MTQNKLYRKDIIRILSDTYYDFLLSINWENELFIKGINEGKNKFLSNTYLHLCGAKHKISNYHSKDALSILSNPNLRTSGKLVFEHMVPKQKYIQKPCEDMARKGELDKEIIYKKLDKYWFIATVTIEEEKTLKTSKVMPNDWDEEDHSARYKAANIELINNPIWI
jgi:hypothetical protein